ncbi:PREDICTED: tubulin-specific chaperone D [Papilio polytes]|uniref:tubulin-specific chaperone D n=1 Tax=Papilio polytes TaxID=76194 RepID=UPI0006762CE5|nr:PREDICTED: tubulin-specific chaperone D [Papilio polytes]
MVGLDADLNKDDECDNIGLGCALEHFSEVEDVMNMIDNLKNIYETPQLEVDYDRLYSILKQYYEQPHLLDPHLDKILAKFIALIKDKESPSGLKHATFNYMYQIIRVRGYKVVVRHLPHEVSDLLTVLTFLEAQDPMDKETWRSRLVLLLWLSIGVIIPFHMSRLDGFAPDQPGAAGSSKKLTVMERIFNMCKIYACSKDSCAEASAYLASKFLTRSDVKEIYLGAFFDWACDLHSNLKDQDTIHYGVLAAVAAVLKHGKRDDLLPYTPKLLQWVNEQNYKHHNAMLVRKYGVKIVQRIGLTFLRPRVASFRYTQGSRSLAVTLGGVAAAGDTEPVAAPPDDEDQDIPQEVEEVVELLLCSLRDEDTVVRWSAAKGVGRIGARLPALAAADVCEIVLTLFAENERDTAWHGGCMALAELARRGLLSPQQARYMYECYSRYVYLFFKYGDNVPDDWLELIEECLGHEVQVIREKAIQALPLVFEQYLSDEDSRPRRAGLMQKYCSQLASTSANGLLLRMGYARAIGALPKFVLSEHLPLVIRSLIECTRVTEGTQKWAESRRDAVVGLTEVCHTLGIVDGVDKYVEEISDALLACLAEYTIDMRGDIGAWVREASMTGLLALCRLCAAQAPQLNSARGVGAAVRGAAQQAVEKIDRTRAHAGRIFTAFIYNDPIINNIPHHEALKRIFPYDEVELRGSGGGCSGEGVGEGGEPVSENSNVVLWLFPGHTMPRFVQLLQYPEYRYSVLKGLVVSAGELTESLVKHTTQSLYSYLHTLHEDMATLRSVCDTIVQVFADNLHVKRITGPMFNFLDRLLSSGAISPILEDPESTFAADILKYLQLELRGGKNIYKLLDSINVLCQLIQVGGAVCSKALGQLVIYLCYADRYVRRCAAARLYEALTLYGDTCTAPQHNLDQVMSILAETDWERDVAELRPIRNDICDLMDIKRPVLKQKAP